MEETLIKRIMPNSLEAEQSVIGSMIMDKDAILTAMEMLVGDDFYYRQYGVLFDAMIELYGAGLPVDLITLQNRLKEKDVPDEIASLDYVRDLITAVPTSANVKYYAKIVKDHALRRRLIKLNEEKVANIKPNFVQLVIALDLFSTFQEKAHIFQMKHAYIDTCRVL